MAWTKPGSCRLQSVTFHHDIRLLLCARTIHSAIPDEMDDAMKLVGIKPSSVRAAHVHDDA